MRIDLRIPYTDGITYLKNWRTGFSKTDYPFKVVTSLFERQYAMNAIWDTHISRCFLPSNGNEPDIIKTYQQLEIAYSKSLQQFTTGNILITLLNQQQDVGGLNYKDNIPLIAKSRNGDNTATEELEFTYLYYLLCNKSTLMWAAFGRKGFSQIDAIAQVTGAIIGYTAITYASILNILGRIGVAPEMNKIYSPFPPLY